MKRLAAVLLVLSFPAIAGAIEFGASSSSGSRSSGRSLRWTHTLGAGSDRVLAVAVTVKDNQCADPGISVMLDGLPLLPVPGGVASGDAGHGLLRTQLFYLLEANLPAPGDHEVMVRLRSTVHDIAAGAVSMSRVTQLPPEAVASASTDRSARTVSVALATQTARAWVVEAVGSDDDAVPSAQSGQGVRYTAVARDAAQAGAAAMVEAASTVTRAWSTSRPGRLTLVAAAFTPLRFALTTSVDGLGTVEPAGGLFSEDEVVSLTAAPRAAWGFGGWSGDASGSSNPVTLTFDGPKTVAAAFTPDFRLYGWAATGEGVTGGEGGPEVVVDTAAALRFWAAQPGPVVIKVAGTVFGNEVVHVSSDKSILGVGGDARLLGIGLQVGETSQFGLVHNVAIRNLTLEKVIAPNDGVFVTQGAHNVWVDHCRFLSDRAHDIDFYDGLLDITNGADFVTASWSRFTEHFKTSLVGSSDGAAGLDSGHLTVTYHHNSFIDSGGRNPSIRFGLGHIFDNFYRDLDDYAVASRMGAQVVIENNWFENVTRPIRADTTLSPVAGSVRGEETNVYVNSGPNSITLPPATWVPPYEYHLDPVDAVPEVVARWSGVGVVTFSGVPPAPTAPTLTVPPAGQNVEPGQDVSFFVLPDGTWPFTYQWLKDGVPIDGATGITLALQDVTVADAGDYTVQVTNAAGSVTSAPATLVVVANPNGGPGVFLRERFADGSRTNQALPDSSAWFSSSGSSNVTVVGSELRQVVTSSRTLITYFTNASTQQATLSPGETVTASFDFRFTVIDSTNDNFRVGLFRSVANPAAVAGTGFVPSGSPNTNARMSGDFGSNAPSSNAFTLYGGYAAFTSLRADATAGAPVKLWARTGQNATLIGATGPFVPLSTGPTPPPPVEANTLYRGRISVSRTEAGNTLTYTMTRVSDGAPILSHTVDDPNASAVAFDTLAFYVNRNTVNFDFFVSNVDIQRTVP